MIIGYVGTPGSGKTYEAVRVILNKLQEGRVVYTNIDGMAHPKCREMIKNVCQISDLALTRQLKVFEDDQLENFWMHIEPQCIVVLDEVQKIFSSRDWQSEKNKQFGYWASTHRHHGYEVLLLTQNPERIDSAVRALFEWTYLFRKVNFFGKAVQQKYMCYSFAGDDTGGHPLAKRVETYNPAVFRCYKSYVSDDVKELGLRKHVNVLNHPIFYAIPVVFGITLYLLFGKSTFVSGDLFGTKKIMTQYEDRKNGKGEEKPQGEKQGKTISPHYASIRMETDAFGTTRFTNRILPDANTTTDKL